LVDSSSTRRKLAEVEFNVDLRTGTYRATVIAPDGAKHDQKGFLAYENIGSYFVASETICWPCGHDSVVTSLHDVGVKLTNRGAYPFTGLHMVSTPAGYGNVVAILNSPADVASVGPGGSFRADYRLRVTGERFTFRFTVVGEP